MGLVYTGSVIVNNGFKLYWQHFLFKYVNDLIIGELIQIKLPIYQEVEKVSGNVIPDSSSAVYLGSISIPVYAFLA